ncbi:MAG: FeoA family protein [Methanomassiliicoccales archaeon]|jgi:Fe2+ transport system protein FeoA
MTETTLETLEPGNKAIIKRVEAAGPARKRVAEMGLSKGTCVEMVRRAPMNDPIEFRVRGYNISLRKVEASAIIVDILEDGA